MKINIVGPSCVGKTTLSKIVANRNGWQHFDLDLVYIDRDYLAETKIFRYRPKSEYSKKVADFLGTHKNWVIEGVYLVEKILKEADLIVFVNLPLLIPLRWQWKRYFTDANQRSTYGLLNNIGLTKEIFGEYFKKYNPKDVDDETEFYMQKYCEVLKKYPNKLRVISKVLELEKLRKSGVVSNLE